MNELEQWCEIDGHERVSYYSYYGLVLGPKTEHITNRCIKCGDIESYIFVPKDQPLSMYTVLPIPFFY